MKGKKAKVDINLNTILLLVIPVVFFIGIPIILNIPCISSLLSWLLKSLQTTDYKVSYIELVGAILGTYLAILGAIWVQKREKNEEVKEGIIKAATIVYYDIKLACLDLINMIKWDKTAISGDIYLVDDWIERVSELPSDKIDIQKVYRIYGEFNNARLKINQARMENTLLQLVDQDEIKNIVTRDYLIDIGANTNAYTPLLYSNNPDDYSLITRYINCDIVEILAILRNIAKINEVTNDNLHKTSEPVISIKLECIMRIMTESLKSYVAEKASHEKEIDANINQINKDAMIIKLSDFLVAQKDLFSVLRQGTSDKQEREAIKEMLEEALRKY